MSASGKQRSFEGGSTSAGACCRPLARLSLLLHQGTAVGTPATGGALSAAFKPICLTKQQLNVWPGLFCLLGACTLVPTWGYNVATLTSPARPSHKNQLLLYDVIGRAVAAHINIRFKYTGFNFGCFFKSYIW